MSDPIPTDRDETRLAIAMAAGAGLRFDHLDAEVRAHYRKAANSALIFLGMKGVHLDAPGWLADRLETIVESVRNAASAMDLDGGRSFPEPLVRAMYANAGQAEAVARVLRGLPEPEAPEPEPEEAV